MIDLYYFPTPNGRKITITLEELQLPYQIKAINILEREQFSPEFLDISPNNKIPAIVDHAPSFEGDSVSIFESAAILVYLAEKTGQLMPSEPRQRLQVLEWLMWQTSGLGPMGGQANHFNRYAREKIPYGIERYTSELNRLYGVMNKQLSNKTYLCGDYSIADIACYGWIDQAEDGGVTMEDYPEVDRWFNTMTKRPAVQRAMALDNDDVRPVTLTDQQHESLFSTKKIGNR
jgi:GST-like protein